LKIKFISIIGIEIFPIKILKNILSFGIFKSYIIKLNENLNKIIK